MSVDEEFNIVAFADTEDKVVEYAIAPLFLLLYHKFIQMGYHFTISHQLHGNPVVYSNDDKKTIKELINDGYLTYVTEVGNNIILQYMTTDNFYYGVLLNDQLDVVAYMPYLCDVVDGELIFDLPSGKVRKSQIYKLEELEEIARR